jgi:hypothetical protein
VYALGVGVSSNFGPILVIALVLLCMLTAIAWVTKLAVDDAKRRGKSTVLVCIACILFFPWGLVAWILFRPDPIDKSKDGFELENYRVQ